MMKKFLFLSCILVVCLFITLLIAECFVRSIPNPYSSKHHWMQQHADSVEVLVLGSSHTYYGVNPAFFKKKAYNLANVSQPFRYDYYLLSHYATHYAHLQKVILPVSYFTFFSEGFSGKDRTGNINYKIYMECPYYSDFSRYNLELSQPEVFRGKLLKALMGKEPRNCSAYGWGTEYTKDSKDNKWDNISAQMAVERHTAKDWSHLGENIQFLRQMATFCQERNIELVLITTPTWPAYYNLLDSVQMGKMYETINEMSQTYNLRYFDYMKDSRFAPDDFYDSDHLSNLGAEKFTRILQEELLE